MKQELITKKKKLPEGWRWVRLGDKEVSKIIMGQSPPSFTYNTEKKGLPFYQGKKDFGSHHPIPTIWCSEPKRIAEEGDILISVRAPVGPTNIANEKCCIGRGLAAIRPTIEKDYLLFLLKYNVERLKKKGRGSTFDAINKDKLYDFKIILPPLPERQKIVSKLDKQMEQIEMMNREAEKEKISSRNILYSELEEIFSNIKGKEILIENLIKDSVSGFACAINRLVKEGGYVHLRPFNIGGFGKLNLETQYQVPLEIVDREKYFLNKENILFNNTNSTELVGKSVLIEEDYNYAFSNHINKIVVNKDLVIPQFFEYYLLYLWFIGHFARNCKKWIGQSGYTLNKLKEQHIIIPEMSKQEKIVEELNKIKDIQDSIKSNSESQMEALNQLPSSILNEVFGQYKIPEEA